MIHFSFKKQYSQLFDEHLSSGDEVGTIRRLRANTPTATDRRLSGTRAVCGVSTVSCWTRVCSHSGTPCATVSLCVRARSWSGVGGVVRALVVPQVRVGERETLFSAECRPPAGRQMLGTWRND